jgi:hypothetical protein
VQEEAAPDGDLDADANGDLEEPPPQDLPLPWLRTPHPEIPKQAHLEPLLERSEVEPELEDDDPEDGDLDEEPLQDLKLPPLYPIVMRIHARQKIGW